LQIGFFFVFVFRGCVAGAEKRSGRENDMDRFGMRTSL